MTFTSPLFLLLLLLLPVLARVGWPAAGPSRLRESVALLLRLSIVASLVLALAGTEIAQAGHDLAVVFLVDVSDSMPKQAVAAETSYVRSAIQAAGPDDQSAVVLFGADALVEQAMSARRELGPISSVPVTNQTDLASAVRLGLALFPSASARRMVILSDGAQTTGDAQAAARLAAASGVQIVSLPLVTKSSSEALVTAVDAPTRLRPGEKFDLNVSIQATEAMPALLRVLAGDKIIYEQTHDLQKGLQTFSLPLASGTTPGFVSYQVQIEPQRDGFYQNNRLDAFSQVEGPPRILVAAPQPGETLPGGQIRADEAAALVGALRAAGFSVDVSTPALLPIDLIGLAQYNSIVLVDVPASSLSNPQMDDLQTYVRDLGGGLVVVGGPTSFGVGGYYDTPLEAALPVDMQIKDEKRRPSLGMLFIIDHSGSMGETSGSAVKLELAKEAAARSVRLLFPADRVGVIAFDDSPSWVVPMTGLSDPGSVIAAIGGIRVGGGTDILAAVQAAAQVLPGDPAKVKHIILLTDGGADPAGIPELVKQLYAKDGITVSTVGVGTDAAPFLKDLAAIGGGRYHFAADAGSIPSIFTEETTLATRAYIVEETFFPKPGNPSPILTGIQSVPQLYGYVATSAKDLAQVILKSDKGDPILATWQYGLGRSLAFTSDATGHWGRDWTAWPGFATFWAQALRYTLSDSSNTALEMDINLNGSGDKRALLTLDARSRTGDFLNGYNVTASIVAPGGKTQSAALQQVAPGRYQGEFDPEVQGVYLVHFSGQPVNAGGGPDFSQTAGWTLSYSPEYRLTASNPDLLARLAALTGGGLAPADPAEIFRHDLAAPNSTRPAWPWLLLLAAILLPLDVASRRLILTRQDWMRFVQVVQARLRRRKQDVPEQTAQMTALLRAKGRAQDSRAASPPGIKDKSDGTEAGASIPMQPLPPAPPPTQAQEPTARPEEPPAATSTTAALLARKKDLRNKRH